MLANVALAGAFHFVLPVEPSAVRIETRPAPPPIEVVPVESPSSPTVEVPTVGTKPLSPREWIAQNPYAAVEWAAQLPDGENRDAALETACYEIANVNPAEAVALAEKYALTNHATLANLTQQWAQQDLGAAYKWVLTRREGEERNDLAARIGYVWSGSQPAAAANFVVQEIPPGPVQTEAAISVLHQWAIRDLNGAMAWVELFPDGDIRQRAIKELAGVRNYSLSDGVPMSVSDSTPPTR